MQTVSLGLAGNIEIGIGGSLAASPTGSPEAVARPRFPQNVACGFPAPTLFDSWFTALQALAAPDKGGAA
ncbi:hypothetical protein ACVIWU_005475 [Bradyrhizobium sp. USDA 4509]